MARWLPVVPILCLTGLLVPACQGAVSTSTGSSTQGSGGPIGCAPPCCEDNAQFPIQRGASCVQCNTDSDCQDPGLAGPHGLKCRADGLCTCAVDSDCAADAASPRCRAADASCVQCLSDADCVAGSICQTASGPTSGQCQAK